jgi:hypothetical protein
MLKTIRREESIHGLPVCALKRFRRMFKELIRAAIRAGSLMIGKGFKHKAEV